MQALTDDDPRQVGEYQLLRRLGAGGMGRVYLGRSPTGKWIAVKMVKEEWVSSPGFRERFKREVRASRVVSGPGTVQVLTSDPDAPVPWLASDYVPGPSLDEAVRGHGPLPVPALWRLLSGLAEALGTVHACGLVHRDLKPANVLLSADGPLLIDFGIARAAEDVALTRTGVPVGTSGYMSPEQWQGRGREIRGASDVFSLGVVLAFAATGFNPFGSGAGVDYRIVHEEPDLSGVPDDLAAVVRKCLAKQPGRRPSPEELCAWTEEHGAGPAHWPPASIASEIARRSEQLLSLEAADRDAGTGHDRGGVPPGTAATAPVDAVPPATAVSPTADPPPVTTVAAVTADPPPPTVTECSPIADLPTATTPRAPITPPTVEPPTAVAPPPTAVATPAGFASPSGFPHPTYAGPPPSPRPPSKEPGLSARTAPASDPAEQCWIAPWVRGWLLGHPLLSLFGLLPMTVLLVVGPALKAQAREHPTTDKNPRWWLELHHWAMEDDGWRVPLTVILIVALAALQYFRARLGRRSLGGIRTWAAAIGGFWLLWSVMVPQTMFWVMGVGDATEEDLMSAWAFNTVSVTWWTLLALTLVAPFTAVAGLVRVLRGFFGDVGRPRRPTVVAGTGRRSSYG
ncbi:serine/threonine-protein kinase [Streptomyces djakartensis]|uniref:Protein kinase domain-containing protein n=1 Tax=Streptomyces djakartensis TaxID=68193 RepID=A0ABQ3A7K4_9ACTN|nr:serine/threonine-protein kinase [Streptomyces djakartensis]GGY35175.1 hypothetical protein GCM10010384_47780 [Streptomyces djakartensis]